jgi:hypothetical protein
LRDIGNKCRKRIGGSSWGYDGCRSSGISAVSHFLDVSPIEGKVGMVEVVEAVASRFQNWSISFQQKVRGEAMPRLVWGVGTNEKSL